MHMYSWKWGISVAFRVLHFSTLLAVLLALFQVASAWTQSLHDTPVHIVLFSQATIDDTLVSLGQIARVSGGTASLRKRAWPILTSPSSS